MKLIFISERKNVSGVKVNNLDGKDKTEEATAVRDVWTGGGKGACTGKWGSDPVSRCDNQRQLSHIGEGGGVGGAREEEEQGEEEEEQEVEQGRRRSRRKGSKKRG